MYHWFYNITSAKIQIRIQGKSRSSKEKMKIIRVYSELELFLKTRKLQKVSRLLYDSGGTLEMFLTYN